MKKSKDQDTQQCAMGCHTINRSLYGHSKNFLNFLQKKYKTLDILNFGTGRDSNPINVINI